jgi:hypothetical protein
VLVVDDTFCTIPTVRILQGGSFLFPPEPYSGQADKYPVFLRCVLYLMICIQTGLGVGVGVGLGVGVGVGVGLTSIR